MDQPGKVANPARGQLNRENEYSCAISYYSSSRGTQLNAINKFMSLTK